jgi:prepilin-type N-terminal cleavage/methylation domain-containing protein
VENSPDNARLLAISTFGLEKHRGTKRARGLLKPNRMLLLPGSPGEEYAMRKNQGFSLIELLLVVAIILIIAAIAVPSFLRSRMAANESAAAASVRSLNSAQISYNSAYPSIGYAATLSALGGTSCNPPGTNSACLIDTQLATGARSGYSFTLTAVTGTPNATYNIIAAPQVWNYSGMRYFCSFSDAVIRVSMSTISVCDSSVGPQQ